MTSEEFYRDILGLKNEELLREMSSATYKVSFKAGQIMFVVGEICNYVDFLEEGLIRGVILDVKGKDITDCFAFRYGETILASFDRLEMNVPSSYTVEVLEDSTFFRIPMETVIELKEKYFELTLLYNRMLLKSLEEHRATKLALHQLPAVDRYLWFLKEYPDLINRVQHKQIASFLSMTPVTLSRIRKNLRNHLDDMPTEDRND